MDSAIIGPYLILIHWKVIYPVDSTIQLLNNWGHDIFIVFLQANLT